jgi:polyhydroxyalkanoate synthesis regulator phasin
MTENLNPPSVSQMIRMTSENNNVFMQQIADHIDKLEQSVLDLQQRIQDLEAKHVG